MKIAFLGLGRMGRELAAHLVTDGHDVTVWNRTASAADGLVRAGAKQAATPTEAVSAADVVVSVLFGPDAVRAVVLDPDLPIRAGAVWIDVTSVSPADADDFQEWASTRHVHYAHSPVVGSLGPARARGLGVILGGDTEAVTAATPVVSTWAAPDRLAVFDTAAKAATAKLVANLTVAVAMQGLVEALRLGHSGGLSTNDVLGVLDRSMLAGIKNLKEANITAASFDDTQFSANLLCKDTRLMLHTSRYPLPATTAAFAAFEQARRSGHGEDDFAVIAAEDCVDEEAVKQ
jgi:3-hydroxyisobutyrate dehydrogenase